MSVLDHVLTVLRDPAASAAAAGAAAAREPVLCQLGRLYRERFVTWKPGEPEKDAARDLEIHRIEHQLGFAPGTLTPPGAAATDDPAAGWMRHVLTRLLEEPDAQGNPEAVLVAGQSGADKGTVTEELAQHFWRRGGCVIVDRNELRWLHPNFSELAAQDESRAVAAVRADVERLAAEVIAGDSAARLHLVIDDSFADASAGVALLRQLASAGYRTCVLGLHVLPAFSWEHAQDRSQRLRRAGCPGRWIDRAEHDRACRGLVEFLSDAAEQGLAGEVHVMTIFGQLLGSAVQGSGCPAGTIRQLYADFDDLGSPAPTGRGVAPAPAAPPVPAPASGAVATVEREPAVATPRVPPAAGAGKPRGVKIIGAPGKARPAAASATGSADGASAMNDTGAAADPARAEAAEQPEADPETLKRRQGQQKRILDKAGRGSSGN